MPSKYDLGFSDLGMSEHWAKKNPTKLHKLVTTQHHLWASTAFIAGEWTCLTCANLPVEQLVPSYSYSLPRLKHSFSQYLSLFQLFKRRKLSRSAVNVKSQVSFLLIMAGLAIFVQVWASSAKIVGNNATTLLSLDHIYCGWMRMPPTCILTSWAVAAIIFIITAKIEAL